MNIKFKATLVILSLMLLTSLILAKKEEAKKVEILETIPTVVNHKEAVIKELKFKRQSCAKKPSMPSVPEIELLQEDLNTELPLPELMQRTGFQVEIDTNSVDFSD